MIIYLPVTYEPKLFVQGKFKKNPNTEKGIYNVGFATIDIILWTYEGLPKVPQSVTA